MINEAFTPSTEDIQHAAAIVAAFEAQPDAGVLSVAGRMVDRPHLIQARRVLEQGRDWEDPMTTTAKAWGTGAADQPLRPMTVVHMSWGL